MDDTQSEDVNHLTYSSYDAVWAMVAGLAHTLRTSPPVDAQTRVSGAAVFNYLTSGAVSFLGAAGEIKFNSNGDQDLTSSNMTVYNVRRVAGERTSDDEATFPVLEEVVVGRISFDTSTYEPEFLPTSYIEWPNGQIYPSEVCRQGLFEVSIQ
jgi:hypothetical protein